MRREQINSVRTWLMTLAQATEAFKLLRLEPAPRHGANGRKPDCIAILGPARTNKKIKLLIETRSRLTPREAIATCSEIGRLDRSVGGVLIACPYISPRVAEICRHHGVGYLDQGGNCDIRAEGLALHVEGRPNPAPDTRPLQNPFASKAARIARLLLVQPGRRWQVGELAKEGRISAGLASKAKNALIEQGYVVEHEGQVVLQDPRGLLDAWVAVYKSPMQRTQLYVMDDPSHAETAVARWCEAHKIRYALAEFSGAWRVAPMVRYKQASIHVLEMASRDSLDEIMKAVRAKPVETGSNLSISQTTDESVFFDSRQVDDLWVASPVQLYLDLHAQKGRGQEAADELLRQVLEPGFKSATQELAPGKARNHDRR